MIKIVSLEFLAGGITLFLCGMHESISVRLDITRFFTGLQGNGCSLQELLELLLVC